MVTSVIRVVVPALGAPSTHVAALGAGSFTLLVVLNDELGSFILQQFYEFDTIKELSCIWQLEVGCSEGEIRVVLEFTRQSCHRDPNQWILRPG